MTDESLKNKTVKGTLWSAADALLGHGMTFVVGIVLARLLSPKEYGLIGICIIFNTVLNSIVDSGFSSAIIRKKDANEEDYNTMFIINMVVSVFMYALLYVCAPLIARFFYNEELIWLTRVSGLVVILNALSITQYTILTKRIDFKSRMKASLFSAIVSGCIGIAMAYMDYGVWALVIQLVSYQASYTLGLWYLIRWMPSFTFSCQSFWYLWGFGWKMMAAGLLDKLWGELNQTVVAKFYAPATLGQYTRAKEYARLFSKNLTSIVQKVSYPVLSKIQDDEQRMVSGYRKIIKMTMFVTLICMFSLGAMAEPLVDVLIGEKWSQAAEYLPYICLSMSLYPLHAINLNMLKVLGRSDLFLYVEIIKKVINTIPLFVGAFISIKAMLITTIVTGFVNYIVNSYYTGKRLDYSSWKQLKDIAHSFYIAVLLYVSIYFIKFLALPTLLLLVVQLIVGVGVFFLLCEILIMPSEYFEYRGIVMKLFKRKSKRGV